MDEKKLKEMDMLQEKQDKTEEEQARYEELFKEYIQTVLMGFYPHGKPRKDSRTGEKFHMERVREDGKNLLM